VLDLDDVGAEVCELHPAERPGHVVADLDDAQSAERWLDAWLGAVQREECVEEGRVGLK